MPKDAPTRLARLSRADWLAFTKSFESVARGPFAAADDRLAALIGAAERHSHAARLRVALIQAAESLQRLAPDGPDLHCHLKEYLTCVPGEAQHEGIDRVIEAHPELLQALRTTALARRGGRWMLEPLPPAS
ncbi:hypothetical protein [Ramlibacter rhizophilus]|uniref:Uncharacterized protein n=1 Tax=Ramlibacter rhizophilus TaxID=1781167 RepID=A0A4Z0BEC2_9BURK|nr:hypothetical protein [Ramlibacter rhizophilus]TFY96813.1 hypothetical protein EZ242_19225 [Ramlibacter rhizophilus]